MISAKTKSGASLDYRRLKCFDLLKINGEEKLIVPLKAGETNIQYYVKNDIIYFPKLTSELQNCKYNKNIIYEVVMLYLNLCKQCQRKTLVHLKEVVRS